jgi:hypothetical protein
LFLRTGLTAAVVTSVDSKTLTHRAASTKAEMDEAKLDGGKANSRDDDQVSIL